MVKDILAHAAHDDAPHSAKAPASHDDQIRSCIFCHGKECLRWSADTDHGIKMDMGRNLAGRPGKEPVPFIQYFRRHITAHGHLIQGRHFFIHVHHMGQHQAGVILFRQVQPKGEGFL